MRIQTHPGVSALSRASVDQKMVQLGSVDSPGLALLKYWSKPLGVLLALLLGLWPVPLLSSMNTASLPGSSPNATF